MSPITPDFTEELVGFVIQSYLTFISFPCNRFYIKPFSRQEEARRGADAILKDRLKDRSKRMTPFYMQFKRPEGYPVTSSSPIIKDRKKRGFDSVPHALFLG